MTWCTCRRSRRGRDDDGAPAGFVAAVVERAELSFVFHAVGDEAGLTAGRGAEVEHGLAGLRVEKGDGEECAGILQIEKPVAEADERLEGGMFAQVKQITG